MEITIKRFALGLFIIIGVVILANCQRLYSTWTKKTITLSFQATQVITSQPSLPTTITPQPSLHPSKTIIPTTLSVPTRVSTPTSMNTWTQLPTLSNAEAEVKIMDLLLNNAKCKLPCWWGITPGETTWNEAYQFLATLSDIEGPDIQQKENAVYEAYSARFPLVDRIHLISLIIVNGNVVQIGLLPDTTVYGHQLTKLLLNNGEPDEIWLAPMLDTPGGSWFYLVLYYPGQGILARYGGNASPIIGYNERSEAIITGLRICPMNIGPELWLVPPNTLSAVMGNSALGGLEFTHLLKPIKEATGLSVENFYLTFTNATDTTCFETINESHQ